MRAVKVALGALAFGLLPQAAHAQEADWSGVYAGVIVGVTEQTTENVDVWCWSACDAPVIKSNKVTIGGTIGANKQVDNSLVVGVEADFSSGGDDQVITATAMHGTPPPTFKWTANYKWSSTVRVRAGLANGPTMFYLTGGIAVTRAEFDEDTSNYPPFAGHPGPFGAHWQGTMAGLTYGVGIEHRIGKFSIKAEAIHSTFPERSGCYADRVGPQTGICITTYSPDAPTLSFNPSSTAVRIGFNYRF